jgi:hypothetical protein
MEGSLNDKKRLRRFHWGVGVLGLTLLISLAFSQSAYDSHHQASSKAWQLRTRSDSFITVRGKINHVVEALSAEPLRFANRSLAVDQRIWNLQMAWSDFRDDLQQPWSGVRLQRPSPSTLDAAVDQFVLAAMRSANSNAAGQHARTALQSLEPELATMESQINGALRSAEQQRDSATRNIAYGRSLSYGAFFALASLLAARLLVSGMRSLKEWIGREPVAAMNSDKLASPQR